MHSFDNKNWCWQSPTDYSSSNRIGSFVFDGCLYRIDLDDIDENSSFDETELRAIRFGFFAETNIPSRATVMILLANGLANNGDLAERDIIQDDLSLSAFISITLFLNIFGSFLSSFFSHMLF